MSWGAAVRAAGARRPTCLTRLRNDRTSLCPDRLHVWLQGGVTIRELTADLFISVDGFASAAKEAAFFGYFGEELGRWVSDHLHQPQFLIMGRVTYEALAQFSASGADEMSVRMTELPKVVFSSTLKEPLVWKNT